MIKLKEFYLGEWRFLRKKLLPLFLMVVFFFIAFMLATYLVHKSDADVLRVWFEKMPGRIDHPENLPPVLWFVQIIGNNLMVVLRDILTGFIPFVFVPLFSLVKYALDAGMLLAFATEKKVVSLFFGATLPHAIIEIPALLYAISLGLLLCFQRSRKILKKKQMQETVFGRQVVISSEHDLTFRRLTRIFLLIIAPLLLLAAFIEAFITPLIAGLLA